MDICFEGIGQMVATFATEKALTPGMAVTVTASGEVGLGEKGDGSPLCGVTVGAERSGAVAVQIGGVVKVRYSGNKPAVGWTALACDGEGRVTAGSGNGANCLVLAVNEGEDEDGKTVVIKL